jgi:predicted lipoprotein with Yx(FWY)xxD motif
MFRLLMMAAALALAANQALAHGSESAAPPPAKKGPPAAPAQVVSTEHRGTLLADLKGMTLYTFDRDNSGNKSNCDGKCAENWVPLAASDDDIAFGDFTVITRNDGSKMWAYRYRPLYTSRYDKAPGEINGFDANNLWHVARPAY